MSSSMRLVDQRRKDLQILIQRTYCIHDRDCFKKNSTYLPVTYNNCEKDPPHTCMDNIAISITLQ